VREHRATLQRAQRRRHRRRDGDHEQERRAQPQGDGRRRDAGEPLVDEERALAASERLRDDERGEHRGREQREDAGEPDVPGPSPRPETIVNVADVEEDEGWREVGWAAGSERTGLNHVDVPPRKLHCPPHCHSAEEQVFIVLEGSGTLELLPSPALREAGREPETHEVRPGHVVSRPAGTAMAHAFRARTRSSSAASA
jgi:mannose-6-phosphate isomerase-like protein (cupin superfamily)